VSDAFQFFGVLSLTFLGRELLLPPPSPPPPPPPPLLPCAMEEASVRWEEASSRKQRRRLSLTQQEPPKEKSGAPTKVLRRMEMVHVELLRLADVSVIDQTFYVQLFTVFSFPGGAHDAELAADSAEFPMGADGKPTFRPSAKWFAAQLDFNNAKHYDLLDSHVQAVGDDLHIKVRYEGIFYELMELWDFPFDTQHLTVSLCINCRTTGMTPVDLQLSKVCHTEVDPHSFNLHHEWKLGKHLRCKAGLSGLEEERKFPEMNITATVGRKPGFFIYNVMLPTLSFVPTAMLQYCIDPVDGEEPVGGRAAICLTILLTSAAYKMTTTHFIPPVSYLTLLNKFALFNALLILVMVFEGCLICVLARDAVARRDALPANTPERGFTTFVVRMVDIAFMLTFGVVWALSIIWLVHSGRRAQAAERPQSGWIIQGDVGSPSSPAEPKVTPKSAEPNAAAPLPADTGAERRAVQTKAALGSLQTEASRAMLLPKATAQSRTPAPQQPQAQTQAQAQSHARRRFSFRTHLNVDAIHDYLYFYYLLSDLTCTCTCSGKFEWQIVRCNCMARAQYRTSCIVHINYSRTRINQTNTKKPTQKS
jgi:hypothetical protein